MASGRPTPKKFAAMLEPVVSKWGYVAERGACARRDVFQRRLIVEFDSREREWHGRDLVQAFLLVDDDHCPAFTDTYGPVGLWLDVHRAIHHGEYQEGERQWYQPNPPGGLPPQLVADLDVHGEFLLNYPSTVVEMFELLVSPEPHPVRHGLSVGQFPGDREPRLLKALILARWVGDVGLIERAQQLIRDSAATPQGLHNVKLWVREYKKRPCVDVTGVAEERRPKQ